MHMAIIDGYREPLDHAHRLALGWLDSLPTRQVAPARSADELAADFDAPLPEEGADATAVVDRLAALAEPGLMAIPSGRFFGWVMGGTLPAALAAVSNNG
jgi:hypothetical protein